MPETPAGALRFKQDVADMGDASSRLMELCPVTFHYQLQADGPLQYVHLELGAPDAGLLHEACGPGLCGEG